MYKGDGKCALGQDFRGEVKRYSEMEVWASMECSQGNVLVIRKTEKELKWGGSQDRWEGREMKGKDGNMVANVRDPNRTK